MRKSAWVLLAVGAIGIYVANSHHESRSNPDSAGTTLPSVPSEPSSLTTVKPAGTVGVPEPEKPQPAETIVSTIPNAEAAPPEMKTPLSPDPSKEDGEPPVMMSLGISLKADRDGKRNHCEGGTLELDGSNLRFTCPAPRESKSVQLTAAQIQGIDKNGIESRAGEKYHFHLKDMNDNDVEEIFRNWLRQTGTTSTARGN